MLYNSVSTGSLVIITVMVIINQQINEYCIIILLYCFLVHTYTLYRKVHTQSAKKWLERLHKEKVPVLVCLTFGDKLYAEHMTTYGEHPSVEHMSRVIKSQTTVSQCEICCNGCKYEFHSDFH